jgi:hypothetical protein
VVALALPQIAYVSRLMRGSMIEVLRSNFIRTARAKGLSEWLTMTRHAARAACCRSSPIWARLAGIITGSVVIEQIFSIPGIGRYFIQGALNRDYTLVMGVVIFYGVLIILFNLLVDVLYGVLDPKLARSLGGAFPCPSPRSTPPASPCPSRARSLWKMPPAAAAQPRRHGRADRARRHRRARDLLAALLSPAHAIDDIFWRTSAPSPDGPAAITSAPIRTAATCSCARSTVPASR